MVIGGLKSLPVNLSTPGLPVVDRQATGRPCANRQDATAGGDLLL